VSIPALDLELPVLALGVDDQGLMALPDSAFSLAWYRFGPRPNDPVGATVIAGHVDTAEEGVGPLARLGDLRPGDRIEVVTRRGTVRYGVTSVDRIAKSVLDLPALFSRAGRARLHLVTCGGDYLADRGGYQDNLVVTARRV
jgi:LPXTG-site transpeptidase (sortase) family protein